MKKEVINQFSDAMNLDLHPIVTPNSVLTDNLNGTFITYNGNEFCLQNDRGNTIKATLTEGFIPIGIKEHNGVLYIVSHNSNTGESEIGTYPGIEWPINVQDKDKYENWKPFLSQYVPLGLFIKSPVTAEIWNEVNFSDFRTSKFEFDLQHPVHIEIQNSYDGSVNLILTDNKTKPRIINTGFSVNGDKYKIINRALKDFVFEDVFDTVTSLSRNTISYSEFELVNITTGGQLKGGNYTFYAKLGDADGNETDIIAESGLVSIFNGTIGNPSTIYGTLADELTDKLLTLRLNNIALGYSKVYLYCVREYSDTNGYLMEEAFKIEKPFDVKEDNSCDIVLSGLENNISISFEDLNITYHGFDKVATMTQQADMLFCGNIGTITYDYSDFDALAKKIKTCLSTKVNGSVDDLEPINNTYTNDGEYYNVQNIYSKVGYWPNEYYRFGVVFILANGQTTPVFNMNGGQVKFDELKSNFTGDYANEYGIFHTPKQTSTTNIIKTDSITPWHFKFDCTDMVESITQSNEYKKYADVINGYFIVRQKRIPEALAQGLHIPIDKYAHVPILPWRVNDKTIPVIESFLDNNRLLKYAPESADGYHLKQDRSYSKVVRVRLNCFIYPDISGTIISAFIFLPLMFIPWGKEQRWSRTIYVKLYYDKDGNLLDHYMQNENEDGYDVIGSEAFYYNHDLYKGTSFESVVNHDDLWRTVESYPGSGNDITNFYYINNPNKAVDDVLANKDLSVGAIIRDKYQKDPTWQADDEAQDSLSSHLIEAYPHDDSSAILSVETTLNPRLRNILNGQIVTCEPIWNVTTLTNSTYNIYGRHQIIKRYITSSNQPIECQAAYVSSNNVGKAMNSNVFASVIGNATDPSQFIEVNQSAKEDDKRRNVVRGKFTPYIGVNLNSNINGLQLHVVQLAVRHSASENIQVRSQDNSPYYCVSKKSSIVDTPTIDVYRGDCFVVTETIRMNSNFIDPSYPATENILSPDCWEKYYRKGDNNTTDWSEINVTDLNTVSLGHWITFKCLASSNISLRSEDPFDVTSVNLLGNARSFYPLNANTSTAGKQQDSELFNAGYGITVGAIRRQQYIKVPYIKQEYSNRIMFSNKYVTDAFVNGYRTFQSLSYHDYDKQYGPIVKLEPWGNNLFCVFEHGLAILPINEKALLQTTTEQTIHIYGHGVLPDQMSIVSQDYGSRYADSVIRTPIGIYGVDTDAKKIWRFSDKQGFETLSDMKIETFLNNYLAPRYNIEIDNSDIRSHYNSFKGDIIFTWYNEDKEYSICFNERQSLWTTRYDWVPLVSENINGEFYSLQKGLNSNNKVGIYSHSIDESSTTKWYGKQHPFEFEFVVSDPIGAHKIYENLQIISNNVQPEELQFEFIGDAYMFNKARIYHACLDKTKLDDQKFASNRMFTNETYYEQYDSPRDKSEIDYSKASLKKSQDVGTYDPFRNASRLNDRNGEVIKGEVILTDNATKQYRLRIPQECRNIETWGRRLGNMHYKEDSWYTNIEPILYDARLNDPSIVTLSNPVEKWNSARIRDKWCKIRVRYSGEDLAVITAIKTIVNI